MMITPSERDSALWRKLVDHYTQRRDKLRADNDNATLTNEETAYLRGRIAECKKFLGLNVPEDQSPGDK